MRTNQITVIFCLFIILFETRACPIACVCKWKNGKQTVECSNKDLLTVPEGMDPGTQVLELSGNNLQALPKEKFYIMDLINLQRIYMSRCKIISIDSRTFKGLTNLVELDLSGNLLETVPTETFVDCPSLMRLTLNSNPISILRRLAFNHLSFLNTLELSQCDICEIEEGAFNGLHSLEWLSLDNNKLTTLRGKRILPETLRGVELHGNKWECDCKILDFRAWITESKIPHSVEPECSGPPRLAGRAIKSASTDSLACLPNLSPTSFYLEIGEGKNISLLCHVNAIPQARVSWWFQGQLLQNDSVVAPGIHLVYYIEEGTEDKVSELFIYNTNSGDNGTFICNAENAAGGAQSNFSLKIILKEEPIIIIVSFPYEYLLAALAGVLALALLVIITIVLSIVKCRGNKKRAQKREKTKEVALQYQQNTSKCSVFREDAEQCCDPLKESSSFSDHQQEMMYSARHSEKLIRAMSPVGVANQVRSPTSLRRYQLEQNPDLINDAESVGRRYEGDGENERDHGVRESADKERINLRLSQSIPVTCMRGSLEFYTDVRLNPSCLLDTDGYPVDFGLPKTYSRQLNNDNIYRTLPYNRIKRQSAANPFNRMSRESDFLSSSSQPVSYENYCPDVRYTADGYPALPAGAALPSQTEGYNTDNIATNTVPCCSTPIVQWPVCVPANLHMIAPNPDTHQSQFASVSKRCVSAQTENTDTDSEQLPSTNKCDPVLNVQNDPVNEILTESPDEGYEGEPSVV